MPELETKKKELEDWLRNHPHAEWETRYDMTKRLAQIEEQIKKQLHYENQKAKIQR